MKIILNAEISLDVLIGKAKKCHVHVYGYCYLQYASQGITDSTHRMNGQMLTVQGKVQTTPLSSWIGNQDIKGERAAGSAAIYIPLPRPRIPPRVGPPR
jgi:hypothetical protein